MRIMIHSNAPWLPAGYATQAAQIAPRFASLGHEVAISAFCGISASRTDWEGIPVYPAGLEPYGSDVLPGHAADFRADLVLTLCDAWVLSVAALRAVKTACWLPVDCSPLSALDGRVLSEAGPVPVAMSEFGRRELERAGFEAQYVPHGIDTALFSPRDRDEARDAAGLPRDAFIIGINGTNLDAVRKGYPEQMAAFALFRRRHPGALLRIHAMPSGFGTGLDLAEMAERMHVSDAIRWPDPYLYATGGYPVEAMAAWYASLDLLSGCSYAEGFGLPLVEAQAMGIPVVATDFSAMTETAAGQRLAGGEMFWNARHRAMWIKPSVAEITAAYEAAFETVHDRAAIRAGVMRYDADRVLTGYWEPVLKILEEA